MAALATYPVMDSEEGNGGFPGTGIGTAEGWDPDDYGFRRRSAVTAEIRAFPNEDILFWRKPEIDNSRVDRQEDPKLWEQCWKLFSVTSLVVVVVVGLLLPGAYGLISGIRLQHLQQKNAMLKEQDRQLGIEESKLLSPERMEELAKQMHFVDPGPGDVLHLRGGEDGVVDAQLRRVRKK